MECRRNRSRYRFVPRLDFGPNNFAICGQLWLSISDEAFSGCNMYTPPGPINLSFRRMVYSGGKTSLDLIMFLAGSCPGLIPRSQYSVSQTKSGLHLHRYTRLSYMTFL